MIYPILHFCCGSAINVKHHVRWGASISFNSCFAAKFRFRASGFHLTLFEENEQRSLFFEALPCASQGIRQTLVLPNGIKSKKGLASGPEYIDEASP